MREIAAWLVVAAWGVSLALLLPLALHRLLLVWRSLRWGGHVVASPGARAASPATHAASPAAPPARPAAPAAANAGACTPVVTVQLPLYNEANVVERLIDSVCRIEYPRARLQIQVLDDSADETSALAAARVARWRCRGIDIEHVRRGDRSGFKAGALARGLRSAKGEFLLILDADFLPSPEIVRRLLEPFDWPDVGMVQARWDHLNEAENWLTRAQGLLLDGHFLLEHAVRQSAGLFFNFNGTAGMWRRVCLEDAGGWQTDTLTEDLDLSYRAQMRGWRFVFRADVGVPAELPRRIAAFEVQQKRWAQGGIQTARKLLGKLLRGPWPLAVKCEALVHLCSYAAYPLTVALGLLILPAALARRSLGIGGASSIDLAVLVTATLPFFAYAAVAGRRRGWGWAALCVRIPAALLAAIGIGGPVTRAVLRGLSRRRDPFVRTPKWGGEALNRYAAPSDAWDTRLKLGLGVAMLVMIGGALASGMYASIPFLALFAAAHLTTGLAGRAHPAGGRFQPAARPGPKTLAGPARRRAQAGPARRITAAGAV